MTAQATSIERWMGAVDQKLEHLTANSEHSREHRDDLYKVMEALSLGIRDLANEVQQLKQITAGHQELSATVLTQGLELAQIKVTMVELTRTANDYKERLAEVRGAGKFATWIKNSAWLIATVIAAVLGYLIRHQRSDVP